MNLSGIVVVTRPENMESVTADLARLPGVEVHLTDPDSGRIIVVQEAESIDEEVAGLKRIKAVPRVIMAEMAYHYFADDPNVYSPDRVAELDQGSVHPYLND